MSDIEDVLRSIESDDGLDSPMLIQQLLQHPHLSDLQESQAFRAARAITTHATFRELPIAGELAARAHQSGVLGAGALFAECADKLALMSGRAQRFGTVTTEHQGDVVLAPLDPSVDDETRAEMGLPSLEMIKANVDRQNRQQAHARAEADGVPGNNRFCRIWRDPSEEELRSRLESNPDGAWADGDELTFAWETDAKGLLPGPVFELPMWRIGDTNLFAMTVRVERLSEAVIGYGFWRLTEHGMVEGGGRGPVDYRFRGGEAPEAAPSNDELLGTLETFDVESVAGRETRKVSVYLPPGHSTAETLPVIYATDGNMFAAYSRRLDAAIEHDLIPRVVVVAAHAARMDQYGNERALEYLPGFDDERFDRHQRFFVDELSAWAEERFGVSPDREQRAIFGCSDGGGHALATGYMHRQRYGHIIAYSTGMPPNEQMRWDNETAPFVHLCAGTLEPGFHQATEAWAAWLHFHQAEHHWTERVCGHDLIQWIEELPRAVARAWS